MFRQKIGRIRNIFLVCFILFFLSSSIVLGQAKSQSQEQEGDVIQQIIELVVKNDPTLKLQEDLIKTIEQMPEIGEGLIDIEELRDRSHEGGLEAPFLSLSQVMRLETFVQSRLERKETLVRVKQTYESLRKNLLSNLMSKITEMARLKNKEKNSKELKSFLETRKDSLEKQVRTGMKEATTLFDLMERIMQTNLEIKNAASELGILKREIAITLGGEEWKELLSLLNKIEEG